MLLATCLTPSHFLMGLHKKSCVQYPRQNISRKALRKKYFLWKKYEWKMILQDLFFRRCKFRIDLMNEAVEILGGDGFTFFIKFK